MASELLPRAFSPTPYRIKLNLFTLENPPSNPWNWVSWNQESCFSNFWNSQSGFWLCFVCHFHSLFSQSSLSLSHEIHQLILYFPITLASTSCCCWVCFYFFLKKYVDRILVGYLKLSQELNSLSARQNFPIYKCKWTTTIVSQIKQLITTFFFTLQNDVITNKTIIEIFNQLLKKKRRFLYRRLVNSEWI